MPYSIPSTVDLLARNRAALESRLNETTPAADKAYNTALAAMEAMADRGLYALAADRVRANSALTAEGADLDAIGGEYGTPRNEVTAWAGSATLPADTDTIIPLGTRFVGPQGLQYETTAEATAAAGVATLALVCRESGVAGNLVNGDELTIQSPVAGAERIATVTATTATGAEEEDDDEYRPRILDVLRAEPGGGGPADYRIWAQAVAGVKRAYPITGAPTGITPYPGMRTVYVEASASLNVDGIAASGLLAQVQAAILADPDTAEPREMLGLTQDTLYVRSITRRSIYCKVVGLTVTTGTEVGAQTAVTAALDTFLRQFRPFLQGLDPDFDRLDEVTALHLQREVQNVLDAYGGSAQNVLFGTVMDTWLGKYTLVDGETLKLGGVVFEAAS